MCPACIVSAQSGQESQEQSVPVLRFYFQYSRKSTDEISKVYSTGLFYFFVQVRANKYRYLSWSIDRSVWSDPEVDDDLRVGAAADMGEGPSLAHFWSQDQITHDPVWLLVSLCSKSTCGWHRSWLLEMPAQSPDRVVCQVGFGHSRSRASTQIRNSSTSTWF